MVEAATGFRKSGFSDEDAASLALVATMYQNVADESISAADSAGFIIAQMKAFNIEAENATHIIDAVNEISNNYAVSSSDLANNLGKVSSALAVGGNSFEEVLGMMTAITEITRNSSTAARGLVSIQSRFNQIIDETSSTGQKLTAFYDKHGIAIKDQDGQLRNLYDVLKDTAGIWDTLDENEQKYFLNIQAGANQTRNLAALMENFDVAVSATATAMDSAGSAAEENGRVMESLQKKIDNLRAAWENFSTNTITKDFIGGIIDAGTQLLTFANTDLGQATVKALLFGTTVGSASGFIGTFISSIGKAIANVSKLIPMFKAGEVGVAGLFGAFSKPTLTLFALGVAGVVAALVLLNEALGNSESAFDKYMSKAQDAAQEQQEYEKKLDDAKAKLEELNKIPYADRTAEQENEIKYLQDLITHYEELIEIKGREAATGFAKAAQEIEKQGISTGSVRVDVKDVGRMDETGTWLGPTPEQFSQLQSLAGEYENVNDAIDAYVEELGIKRYNEDLSQKTQEQLIKEIQSYGVNISNVTESVQESSDRMWDYSNALSAIKAPTQDQIEEAQRLLEANAGLAESYRGIIENGGALSDEQQTWLTSYTALEQTVAQSEQAINRYKDAIQTFKEFSDGKAFSFTEDSFRSLSQSLINNSALGIQSVDDLKSSLQQLANGGYISFSNIEGGIDGFIQRLMEVEGFDFSSKTVDITTDDSDAIEGIDEVASELESIPENIVANISTTSDAEAMTGALNNLNTAIDKLQGKSVDVTIGAKTDSAITALGDLKSQIEGAVTDVDINAVGNDMATPMLERINSLAVAIPRNISVVVTANTSQAISALNRVASYRISGKNFSVTCTDFASATINAIIRNLANIRDKTVTVTVNYEETGATHLSGKFATGTNYFSGGQALVNDGSPVNGSAGELVVANGMGRIYNGGEETVANLPQGSKIYTAAETQQILKDQGLTVDDLDGRAIPAMANGTNNNKYPDYRLDPNYSGVTTLTGSGEDLKKNFDEWLKEKKHFLNMDVITEAQYYRDLEIMNERYLKNMEDYRDDYWQHEEEIYNWRNQSLEEQIALEEKLEELAKAKTQKVLTYTGGRFQYLQNIEAIAAAQREVDKITGKYADGTMSARGGLSLVGERGPELRVLKNGDGIVPADATKNLLSLSRFSAKDIIGAAKSNIMQYAFNISNISLPNVHSPEDFVDGLRNLAYQYSFSRA